MSRLSRVERDSLSPESQTAWDAVANAQGQVRGPFYALVRVPALANAVSTLGDQVRFASNFTNAERELTILAIRRACGEAREATHDQRALKGGVRPEAVAILREHGDAALLEQGERPFVEVARMLVKEHKLDDALFARAVGALGEERLIELVGFVGFYALIAMVIGSFGFVEPERA